MNNRELVDFRALRRLNAEILSINHEDDFGDTSIFNEKAKNISLTNTGIKELNFSFPENIEVLSLASNQYLVNVTQISRMKNLSALTTDKIRGIDFTALKKLKRLTLNGTGGVSSFPKLANSEIDTIDINCCGVLDDLQSLHGTKVKNFTLSLLSGSRLEKFMKTLQSMEITHLTIDMLQDEVQLPPGLKEIKGLTSLKYQHKSVLKK